MATAKKTTAKAPAKPAANVAKQTVKSSAKRPAKASTRPPAKSPAKPAGKAPAKSSGKAPAKPAAKPSTRSPAKRPAKQPAKAAATARSKSPAKSPAKSPGKSPGKSPAGSGASQASPASRKFTPAPKAVTQTQMSSAKTTDTGIELPKPKFNKDGLGYTKDFDLAFIKQQYDALQAERVRLTGQALRLEQEANDLVTDAEMGDVKFDDEGGEGDTMAVERERDLALSAQAREAIQEIDAALMRIAAGTYGYSVVSGRPIPRERLEALPWSSVLVEEKVGGIGRR